MAEPAGSAVERRPFAGRAVSLHWQRLGLLKAAIQAAFEAEVAQRRLFLWIPVAAGAGVTFYLEADQEPSLIFASALAVLFAAPAWLGRGKRAVFMPLAVLCAISCGMVSAGWRSIRVAAPVLDHTRMTTLEGFVEQMDFRRQGARFLLRVSAAEGMAPGTMPLRVRLTLRRTPPFEAGTYVRLKARLLPPAHASLPGGYDFARDAWFMQLGGVGNVVGLVNVIQPPIEPGLLSQAMFAIDRGRNALARRVDQIIGGDGGAIAAAMVTGKRDLLSDHAKEMIREAGIFHIITISGVQMTLVAGIFFVGLRRALALSPTLALRYPIKKWAAGAAIVGAIFYDIATGSRIGTERALFMTVIMLAAVLFDRQALTMRNLAFAALAVILIEPEAILGASFQLSFAAVAALVAVYEGRMQALAEDRDDRTNNVAIPARESGIWDRLAMLREKLRHGPGALLFATFCATSATASFMAYNFHELSPYVLIGNPLTLLVIEMFAVPGALLGTVLYPLGLDAFVWHYVGAGIGLIMWMARFIGSLPASTVNLPAFAPWAIVFLTLAVLSAVIWRTLMFRLSAVPLALIGLSGAISGPSFDLAIAPAGDAAALRTANGQLAVLGRRPSAFAAEQWLRADADGRLMQAAKLKDVCDRWGCVGSLPDGRAVSLVLSKEAFAEDCLRASVIVTPLYAPGGCAAPLVIDRDRLQQTGAMTLKIADQGFEISTARAPDEDRPWSRPPPSRWGKTVQGNSMGPEASDDENNDDDLSDTDNFDQ
jgi:competence protein ComEC